MYMYGYVYMYLKCAHNSIENDQYSQARAAKAARIRDGRRAGRCKKSDRDSQRTRMRALGAARMQRRRKLSLCLEACRPSFDWILIRPVRWSTSCGRWNVSYENMQKENYLIYQNCIIHISYILYILYNLYITYIYIYIYMYIHVIYVVRHTHESGTNS